MKSIYRVDFLIIDNAVRLSIHELFPINCNYNKVQHDDPFIESRVFKDLLLKMSVQFSYLNAPFPCLAVFIPAIRPLSLSLQKALSCAIIINIMCFSRTFSITGLFIKLECSSNFHARQNYLNILKKNLKTKNFN